MQDCMFHIPRNTARGIDRPALTRRSGAASGRSGFRPQPRAPQPAEAEQERGPEFLRLANAPSTHYPRQRGKTPAGSHAAGVAEVGTPRTMLEKLHVRKFKSLAEVSVEFPRMSVIFGPNAAGKSNLLDSIQTLSRIGTQRTLMDALGGHMIRGHPIEAFALPVDGIHGLLSESAAQFSIETDLTVSNGEDGGKNKFRYRIEVGIATNSGVLSNCGESLSALSKGNDPTGAPAIETEKDQLLVRRQSGGGRPRSEELRQNYAVLSDPRLGNPAHKYIERVRTELLDWRTYYLDPRLSMRTAIPPLDVRDIGVFGEHVSPFLYKLKAERRKHFDAIVRTVRSIIPGIETLDVDLDRRRGTLDLFVRQDGIDYSSRVVSEGTLRVPGLCAIAVNPWGGSLLAFEEPENGVHPRRLELIARLLVSLALDQGRQVVVTTHSPIFCDAVLKEGRSRSSEDVALFNVLRLGRETEIRRFETPGPLYDDPEIAEALTSEPEDGRFESLVLRGLVDE